MKFLYPRADRSYITPSPVCNLLMRLLQRLRCRRHRCYCDRSALLLPVPPRSVGGQERISANLVICRLYILLYRASTFVTQTAFLGDNERKRWDASLPRPSPPRCSFISPSHKAESSPATSAACCIENRQQSVWDEKPVASCGHRRCSAPGWRRKVPRAPAGPTPICVGDIGMHVKSISGHTSLMKVSQAHKFVGIFN